jgi:ribose transport system ATP-binding protein
MSFAGTRVLDGVQLSLAPGEIHALVGHNGSGKSTLVKILAGQYTPDPGSKVMLGGQDLPWGAPAEIARQGLRVVHQHLGLIDSLSITENVAMGFGYSSAHSLARIKWRQLHDKVSEQMARLGYDVDPRQLVSELSSSTRSAVAVARAMMPRESYSDPRVVLLDEVTATMPEDEIERLAEVVRALGRAGVAVLYITHHLEEVMEICDRVTILRDGRKISSDLVSATSHDVLADRIVGSSAWRRESTSVARVAKSEHASDRALTVTGLSGEVVRGLSFRARTGSVLGIAGIAGSGREEVAELLLGSRRREGKLELGDKRLGDGKPSASIRTGVALVPADRLRNAVVPNQNIRENVVLSRNSRRRALTRTNVADETKLTSDWIDRLAIRGATVNGSISTLSGGNQQKVILARCLSADPEVLILDEPTNAVDIGAVAEIHRIISELSSTAVVIVCSSDNRELADLCSEVIVLYRGQPVATLTGAEITEENLDHLTIGSFRTDEVDVDVALLPDK